VLVMVMERVLFALVVVLGYVVLCIVKPKHRCGKCSGNGSRASRRSRSACGRCGATGRSFRPGARLVHAGLVLVVHTLREHRGADE
jgi:hypothetical protein